MANYAYQVFVDHRDRVKIGIRASINGIAGKSFAVGLIDEDVHHDVTEVASGRSANQNAVMFLNTLQDKINLDGEPALIKFIQVLRESDEQVYKTIIDELDTALATARALAAAPVPTQPPQEAPVRDQQRMKQ